MFLDRAAVIDVVKRSKWKTGFNVSLIDVFCKVVNEKGRQYKLDTPERLASFVGQCVHETMGFSFFGEAGYLERTKGKSAMEAVRRGFKYYPYYGRGPIQTTLVGNYRVASMEIFGDQRLVDKPEILDDPYLACWASLVWWAKSKAPSAAQKLDFVGVSNVVNKWDKSTFAQRSQLSRDTVNIFKSKEYLVQFKGEATKRKLSLWSYLNILKNWHG